MALFRIIGTGCSFFFHLFLYYVYDEPKKFSRSPRFSYDLDPHARLKSHELASIVLSAGYLPSHSRRRGKEMNFNLVRVRETGGPRTMCFCTEWLYKIVYGAVLVLSKMGSKERNKN